jgi:hypothetical protein
MLKASQKRTKRAALIELLMSRQPGQHQRVVGDDAHRLAFHAGEADHDVLGVLGLQLEEVAVVHRLGDQLLHVVGLVRVVRHQRVEREVHAVGRIVAGRIGGFSRLFSGR